MGETIYIYKKKKNYLERYLMDYSSAVHNFYGKSGYSFGTPFIKNGTKWVYIYRLKFNKKKKRF